MDIEEQIKKCTKCNVEKLECEFRKSSKGKFGVSSICKICQSNIEKNNRLNGKSTSIERNKRFRENNPDKIKKWLKEYRVKNKKRRQDYDKNYRLNNKDLKNKQNREYYIRNPHLKAWRCILKSTLKRMGKIKESNTIDLLRYSALDLKNHITTLFTEGMSWSNHGKWEIDHIKPVSAFDKDTHPSIVNALSNLQPLWRRENRAKGNIF